MNIFRKIYCRTFQLGFRLALPILPYREPKILENNQEVIDMLKDENKKHVFFVTDKNIRGIGITKALETALTDNNIAVTIYDDVLPNPTISMVESALKVFKDNMCDSIIALGGGSVIDLAKVVGARSVYPEKSVSQMKGLLKVNRKLPLLLAIPTTAGTGSETTLAAVITDDKTHHKYPINSFPLIPHYALLDNNLILGLNPYITATTGLDALTHAIEAYIGRSTTKLTRTSALESIKLIYENLKTCYDDGKNAVARQNMLKASYLAGVAFTRSYVGYVHAVAHSLGGKYGVAHGLANSIILPVMLREYDKSIYKKLHKIAIHIGLSNKFDTPSVSAERVISWIEGLNEYFNIPKNIDAIKYADIEYLAKLADKEANPLYPVPVLMNRRELELIYLKLMNN